MERAVQTLEPAYFDGIYAASGDPWRFASSAYELSKYALTLEALPRERYPQALEIGCSIGSSLTNSPPAAIRSWPSMRPRLP